MNTFLRRVIGVFWPKTNEEFNRRTGWILVELLIRKWKWQCVGHTLRKGHNLFFEDVSQGPRPYNFGFFL